MRLIINVYLILFLSTMWVAASSIEDRATDSAKKAIQPSKTMLDNIQNLVDQTKTHAWQQEQKQVMNDLADRLDVDIDLTPENPLLEKVFDQRLVVFISESVPLTVLRSYAKSLDKVQGTMVLRGMKNGLGRVGPTMRFVSNIIKKDPQCRKTHCSTYDVPVLIDPILFTDFAIDQVPAITLIPNDQLAQHCQDQSTIHATGHQTSVGDASLLTHLAFLRTNGNQVLIDPIIRTLEGRDDLD